MQLNFHQSQFSKNPTRILFFKHIQKKLTRRTKPYFTGKEQDAETGLYYYGARYLDPKTSRWLSGDPAMGDYIPGAPVNEEAKKRNGNLPGQGGVFKYVNLHTYHYAGNNPVKYTDPTGRDDIYYDEYGKYIETIESQTTNVYLRNEAGDNTLLTNVTEFNKFTAAVYGESSGNSAESTAIANVIMNRSDYTGRTVSDIIDNTGIYGYSEANQAIATNGTNSNSNESLTNARAGVIQALMGNDISNGAYFFEGLTFITPESPNYNENNWFVKQGWGTTPGTAGKINYLETTRIGGTVFMQNNPQYHGNRRYP